MISTLIAFAALIGPAPTASSAPAKLSRDYPVQPVPFNQVKLTDGFWAPRIEVNRTASIPAAFQKCEETGRVQNFLNAAATLRGEDPTGKPLPGYPFDDTDIYKVIEGASYSLSVHPDPKLDAYVDNLIKIIGAAQEPDGYLYTARTINPKHPHAWSGPERWVNEQDQSHELYDSGHLFESAVAHFQATGKRTYLNIAIKNADLLVKTFGPGKRKIWPGHEIVEMGLAKLYRATGNQKYLDLAKFLLDSRGGSGAYWQAQEPVVEQTEAVGHAVRAAYLYSGMADVAALTGDPAYLKAIDRIWENVVSKKIYITGGIGATGAGEAFGANYELPNMSAYNETCAAVGNDYWNYRLFLLHGDAKYIDVLERTLYNGLISGVSLDGKTFFYPNPLESRGQHQRSPWFGVACCPGNITRFMASAPGYVYASKGSSVYVNLFASSQASVKLEKGGEVHVSQTTNYPWDGSVAIGVDPAKSGKFRLMVRIPGWARNQPTPSDLYLFEGAPAPEPTLSVNGKSVPVTLEQGYAVIDRDWKKGDKVSLELPMPVRRVTANSQVKEDIGKIALQRGPIVYCAEWADSPTKSVRNLMLPNAESLKPVFKKDELNGVMELTGNVVSLSRDKDGAVEQHEQAFTAIPYYAWANRGRGEMRVWLPSSVASATPTPYPTLASKAKVTTSGGTSPTAINRPHDPANSVDQSDFFHWWPKKGTNEWVEYTFDGEQTISESSIYWFDDTGIGECRVPASWKLLYRDGNDWKPVQTTDALGTALNQYNIIHFTPVKTSRLRLEVALPKNFSAGIQQWRVK